MSGKWFSTGDSSSEDSGSESEDFSQDEQKESGFMTTGSRFDRDEDEEEDRPRRMISAKEKAIMELTTIETAIKNKLKSNDWKSIQDDFDKLERQLRKVQTLQSGIPKAYIRTLALLDTAVTEGMEQKQSGAKLMKQKLKKVAAAHAVQIKACQENPAAFEEVEEEDEEAADKPVKALPKSSQWTDDTIKKKLDEIVARRGKKGVDRLETLKDLSELLDHTTTPWLLVEVYVQLVSSEFDRMPSTATHLPHDLWKNIHDHLTRILNVMDKNKSLKVEESDVIIISEVTASSKAKKGKGAAVEEPQKEPTVGPAQLQGSFAAFLERLESEHVKSLQYTDPHSDEYVRRLQDEPFLLELSERIFNYYRRTKNENSAARVASVLFEHLYYRRQEDHEKMVPAITRAIEARGKSETKSVLVGPVLPLLEELSLYVFKHEDARVKTRAVLCHAYSLALHDQFHRARDLLTMSQLHLSDLPTQILFNRTMAQLGLCAFRIGLIAEAHACLAELYLNQPRIKELLAQGVMTQRFGDRKPEQEQIEREQRARLVPYHMHINLDMLEAVHFICAMLLEVPNMAANPDDRKRIISRSFRKLLEQYDRLTFVGPPESTRDHINAASRALLANNWRRTVEVLLGMHIWIFVYRADAVKEMIQRKIQEEALRTFLLTHSKMYSSISLEKLSQLFDLSESAIHSLCSRMIADGDIHASWNGPSSSLVLHDVEPSRLQTLAVQYADKVASLVNCNEQLVANIIGAYDMKSDQQSRRQDSGAQYGRYAYQSTRQQPSTRRPPVGGAQRQEQRKPGRPQQQTGSAWGQRR